MQQNNEIKIDESKIDESDFSHINNDDYLKQKHILEFQKQPMCGSNIPVYGHLVTADQLNQIEHQKCIIGFHHQQGSSKTNLICSDNFVKTFSDNLLYANITNEPTDITNVCTKKSSPKQSLDSHSTVSCVIEHIKLESKSDKDTSAPYYHYPYINNCLSSVDRGQLHINILSSKPHHNFTTTNSNSYSKGIFPHHRINVKSHSSLIQRRSLLEMDIEFNTCVNKCPNKHIIIKMSVDLIKTYKNINEIYYRKKRRLKDPTDENSFKKDRKINNEDGDNSDCRLTQNFLNSDVSQNKILEVSIKNIKKKETISGLHVTSKQITSQNYIIAGNVQANLNISLNKDLSTYEYIVKAGEIWKSQYCIEKLVGTGSFGQVVRAKDLMSDEYVAIKIIKNKRNFVEQAYIEIDLLKEIGKYQENEEMAQETGANYIVKLKTYFNHRGHLCLVFELLTYTLYDLLKNTNFRGVSLNLTRKFAQQICKALVFLSRPQVQIIHCDLKPENILLLHPRRSAIKVVDFGSSCHANRRIYYYIQSRFYRSPEIILNLDYSHAIDMWSLGCIMAELHCGQPLFIGQFEHEQILRIIEVVGMPSNKMIDNGKKSLRFFERFSSQNSLTKFEYKPKLHRDRDGKKISFNGVSSRSLSDIIGVYTGGPRGQRLNEPGHSSIEYEKFLDLIERMLIIDPNKRIKPDEALNHPFFVRAPSLDCNSHLQNSDSKIFSVTPTSTSFDKSMISTAAITKDNFGPRMTLNAIDNVSDKLSGDAPSFVVTRTSLVPGTACESILLESVPPEPSYIPLSTLTTTAN